MKKYIEMNGTSYDEQTDPAVIKVLEAARINRTRIKIDFGNVETYVSWQESFGIIGYVGRSTGSIKIPILVHNKRSLGGGAILTACILSIRHANKKDGGYLYARDTDNLKGKEL